MNHLGDTNKMVSDTPRTDVKRSGSTHFMGDWVDANFAAQLERELNAANDRIKRLEELGNELRAEEARLLNTNGELERRIKRLEDAGDAVAEIIGPPGSAHWADENQVDAAWNNWLKAKEDKL